MDANKTRFHLLLGRDDWARSTLEDGPRLAELWSGSPPNTAPVAWDDRNAELTLTPRLFRFKSAAANRAPSIDDRRGAAADRYGNWYWIGPDRREILVNSSGTGLTSHFWSSTDDSRQCDDPEPGTFAPAERETCTAHTFAGLAVTEHHYLAAGVLDPPGLAIFDLHHGGPPRLLLWPPEAQFAPFDLSAAPGGGLWLLDRDHGTMWVLDRTFSVVPRQTAATPAPDTFQSASGQCRAAHQPPRMPAGIPLGTNRAIAIQALPDNTVLILEPDKVSRYRFEEKLASTGVPPAHDLAVAADVLYIASADGDQSFAFRLHTGGSSLWLDPLLQYFPMRLFGGRSLVEAGGRIYYDSRDIWVPLVEQRQPRYDQSAILVSRRFDGKEPDCVWHRLLLDACIPHESDVRISSRADNDPDRLAFQTWQLEPRLYQRFDGSEQPFLPRPADPDRGTWEVLPQRAKGRYLQLKLEVSGNGKTTPRLRALRIYYPRFSYLRNYLPRAYQEDAGSSSFLDRFLSNVEGFFTGIEDRIAFAQVLLDLRSATPDTLGWLASWFGLALDPSWTPDKQRLFLRHAMEFFQYRGTVRGLTMALRLALEDCADDRIFDPGAAARPGAARVTENFRKRQTPALAAPSSRWTPALGAPELNRRYTGVTGLTQYPISEPASLAAPWRDFSLRTLGFVPRISADDLTPWADFLSRRYRDVTQLNTAYGALNDSFSNVPLPQSLPVRDAPLRDWFEFQGLVLPMRAAAHRFTIMLPVPVQEAFDLAARRRRLDLTKRIIDLEKPAHTLYDIRFFWAFFRLGEARLGDDSVLDSGSRAPRLLPPMVLGEEFIGSSYFAPRPPQDATDRHILGRDVLRSKEQSL